MTSARLWIQPCPQNSQRPKPLVILSPSLVEVGLLLLTITYGIQLWAERKDSREAVDGGGATWLVLLSLAMKGTHSPHFFLVAEPLQGWEVSKLITITHLLIVYCRSSALGLWRTGYSPCRISHTDSRWDVKQKKSFHVHWMKQTCCTFIRTSSLCEIEKKQRRYNLFLEWIKSCKLSLQRNNKRKVFLSSAYRSPPCSFLAFYIYHLLLFPLVFVI